MNFPKLKGKLVEKGKTYADCAAEIGISTTSFNSKINEKTKFDISEIAILKKYLELSDEEAIEIFLS